MAENILEMRHVTKAFGGIKALKDVSIDLRPHEILAICGENGAGKSTLMKVLSGAYHHSSYQGEILVDGVPQKFATTADASAAGIEMIHQEISVHLELTIAENIFLGRIPVKNGIVQWKKMNEEAKKYCSIFGKLAMRKGYSALTLTLYSFFFCTLGCSVLVDWNVIGSAVHTNNDLIWWMLGLGLITSFLPYTLYSIGLSKMDAGKASILVSIELVAEATIGLIVFKEPLSAVSVVGIALVLSAIVILNLHSQRSSKNRNAGNQF